MERYTQKKNDNEFQINPELIFSKDTIVFGPAIDRLGRFEDFFFGIKNQLESIDSELQSLRDADKTKTVRYRELFGNKLMLNQVMTYLRHYGFE